MTNYLLFIRNYYFLINIIKFSFIMIKFIILVIIILHHYLINFMV